MEDDLNVYTRGPWNDQAQGLVWTVNETSYTIINLLVGVCFGLAQPCVERVLAHTVAWLRFVIDWSGKRKSGASGETDPLLNNPPSNTANNTSKARRCSRWSTLPYRKIFSFAISAIALTFGIAYAAAGAFVTTVPSEQAALSKSTTCGLFVLKDDAKPAAQDMDALIQGSRETRAGEYARDCYGPQSAPSLNQCMLFKQPQIPTLKPKTEQQCPFVNETYCSGTGYSAVKFATDDADATHIGLNAKRPPKIRRTSICVPLDLEVGFTEKLSGQAGHWGYDLGPVNSTEFRSKYTFEQYGDPFTYDVRAYTMSTYTHVYSKSPLQNYWQPIPDLAIRPELTTKSKPYSLTITFINSCRIFYQEPSSDPVFPADRKYADTDLYVNNDSRARPLVCIDWVEVCTPDGNCLPTGESEEDNDKNLVFTRFAMNKSTAFNAIEFRGATGLDAQDKIRDETSLPLAKDLPQWVIEGWSLFNTSLSRIQYDALDMASGVGQDKTPLYEGKVANRTMWTDNTLCHILRFQVPKGYDNVRVWPTVGILLIPLLFGLVGMSTNTEFSKEKQKTGYFSDLKLMGLEWMCWKLCGCCLGRKSDETLADPNAASSQAQARQSSPQPVSSGSYGSIISQSSIQLPSSGSTTGVAQNITSTPGTAALSSPVGVTTDPSTTAAAQNSVSTPVSAATNSQAPGPNSPSTATAAQNNARWRASPG